MHLTGLLVYFLAVFWFLPWRTSTQLANESSGVKALAALNLAERM